MRILSYHGKSIDDFVAKMRSVSYDRPEAAMRAMIDRRHLAPAWGGKDPLSPEPEDNRQFEQYRIYSSPTYTVTTYQITKV